MTRKALALAAACAAAFICGCRGSPPASADRKQVVMNRLNNSTSAYLRSAADQPVGWYEWSDEAFAAAREQNKPVLLDIGAVWCHWCHVIDRESYENQAIAEIINREFIPIKVDVDVRPDIDRRYQEVVQAMTGHGGWPLTVFLTPDGQVIYGGTYFPPEDRMGMPGMKTILNRVAEVYRTQTKEVTAQAHRIHQEIAQFAAEQIESGDLAIDLVSQILDDSLKGFDPEQGGFGQAPKFPAPTLLELLLRRAVVTGDKKYLDAATRTLDAIAAGGIRDQLGGAIHRYSTDRSWRVPHFEVMLYLNGELLKVYSLAYQITGSKRYEEVVRGLLGYVKGTLSDQSRGGFYGSQDADYSLEDDGDYWTWTVQEAKAALTQEDFPVLARYYGIEEQGEMRENPAKNVLYEAVSKERLVQETGQSIEKIEATIQRGRQAMLAAREKRQRPFVDKTIYTNWNALMVSGFLAASVALDEEEPKTFALRTLNRIWKEGTDSHGRLYHVIQEEGHSVKGFLEDYAYLANAFLDAFEVTQQPVYLERAKSLADRMVALFGDNEKGGFFDGELPEGGIAVLQTRRKPIQDAPTPAGNGIAALVMSRLFHYTNENIYSQVAADTLRSYAKTAGEYALFAASFGIALESYAEEPLHVVLVGSDQDPKKGSLLKAVWAAGRPHKTVRVISSGQAPGDLPEALEVLVKNVGMRKESTVFICSGSSCAQPTSDPLQVKRLMESFGLSGSGAVHGRR
ncbi:MAG: thioredoxin domain-containing protein [Candidatus Omnitrophica bacterium]|nr:thioredoxin domain-containing protein [Candidatus Omnitrophota bacterium]